MTFYVFNFYEVKQTKLPIGIIRLISLCPQTNFYKLQMRNGYFNRIILNVK